MLLLAHFFLPAHGCLCQAAATPTCLKAFANLSMVDCMLALIAWQLFVAILRCVESICPSGAISLIAPLIIVLCFARKSTVYLLQRNLVIAEENRYWGKLDIERFASTCQAHRHEYDCGIHYSIAAGPHHMYPWQVSHTWACSLLLS